MRISLLKVNDDRSVLEPYTELKRWIVSGSSDIYGMGLRDGLLAGIVSYLRKSPGVKENAYAVGWVDHTEKVCKYAWDFGTGMRYHFPASPDLPTYPDASVMRIRPRDNTPGAYWQLQYKKSLTEFKRGFMDGIGVFDVTEEDVFYRE
jgi:hypothetical protein